MIHINHSSKYIFEKKKVLIIWHLIILNYLYFAPRSVINTWYLWEVQAWSEITKEPMVRWARVHHTVPNPARGKFQLHNQSLRRRRDSVVACTQCLDQGNSSWSYCGVSQGGLLLPISKATQGVPIDTWLALKNKILHIKQCFIFLVIVSCFWLCWDQLYEFSLGTQRGLPKYC